jgi:hypothetical protein
VAHFRSLTHSFPRTRLIGPRRGEQGNDCPTGTQFPVPSPRNTNGSFPSIIRYHAALTQNCILTFSLSLPLARSLARSLSLSLSVCVCVCDRSRCPSRTAMGCTRGITTRTVRLLMHFPSSHSFRHTKLMSACVARPLPQHVGHRRPAASPQHHWRLCAALALGHRAGMDTLLARSLARCITQHWLCLGAARSCCVCMLGAQNPQIWSHCADVRINAH